VDEARPLAQRWALAVEYDGSGFAGFQRQPTPGLATVQGALEAALSQVGLRPSNAPSPGVRTPGSMPPGRWFISMPPSPVPLRPGCGAETAWPEPVLPFTGLTPSRTISMPAFPRSGDATVIG